MASNSSHFPSLSDCRTFLLSHKLFSVFFLILLVCASFLSFLPFFLSQATTPTVLAHVSSEDLIQSLSWCDTTEKLAVGVNLLEGTMIKIFDGAGGLFVEESFWVNSEEFSFDPLVRWDAAGTALAYRYESYSSTTYSHQHIVLIRF